MHHFVTVSGFITYKMLKALRENTAGVNGRQKGSGSAVPGPVPELHCRRAVSAGMLRQGLSGAVVLA